jgi:hypothetical protein
MRVMVIVRASEGSEGGILQGEGVTANMARSDDELVRSGVLLAAEGLRPASEGVRLRVERGTRAVVREPSSESKGPITGFWLWQVKSLDEAIEWVNRFPGPSEGEAEFEIRQVLEPEESRTESSREANEREDRLPANLAIE